MAITSNEVTKNAWILDSGVTHHLTHTKDNLTHSTPYNGFEYFGVSNGSTHFIDSHDSIVFHPLSNESLLHFSNVLHTPCVSSNLIYVNKLCHDNDAIVKFHS